MTTFGYCRVSTDRQADTGESLTVQERAIAGYCMLHNLPAPALYIERAVSGSVPFADRPQGGTLLKTIAPGDTIVTPKMDRAFRSAVDALNTLATLQAIPVTLHMIDLGGDVSSPGIGKLVFTILAAVAEGERDRIRERIREVKRDQAARNRYLGGRVPFGYTIDPEGALTPNKAQQAALVLAKNLRESGVSLRVIAAQLTAGGHSISHQGVAQMLGRPPAE